MDGTGIGTINNFETRHQNSKGGEYYILTSSKPTSKKFIEPLTTNPSKKRKITLAILIVAVSLSVAIEIGYATSLAQGYSSTASLHKQTVCTGKVLDLSQKGVIGDVGGFSGAIYECTHTKYADSIYGNVINT
ncbi:MAG: hypothetical protein WAM14_26420 [Candidatus Nitrosopolaris sp.]